ncbi:MAG: hypothetical protein H0T89_36990, partial [Deltaproteobacteria bacterium]|nr:hypothetical protein [Deltaproteobacteria bacterium]
MRTLACFVVVLAACASSSKPGQQCDPTTTNCAADAGPEADAPPDGPPLKGFGEACSDGKQCESNLCILVGTSGQCTQLCGDCPDGYGCLAVEGIQIEGTVSFVCVPTSNQLCTTCTQDSECTLIGMDKCVTYPDGDRTCARDCSTVGCPVGYDCETVAVGGVNYQQCMASSGACDCTAANPGAVQPCNIMTPWNVCLGSQTCGGATGWNTCAPPSPVDDPDATFVDSNCDGLDGDRMRAIFVSGAGSNSATCGLDYTDPCQTIQFAITRAVAAARPHVYVQSGTYSGSLAMTNGISIFGGYNVNWVRASYVNAGHTVTLLGGVVAVRFDAITASTMLDNIIVRSANATGTGASSIGVLVTGSTNVALRGVQVDPGAGTAGAAGSGGTPGSNGGNGAPGNPGREDSTATFCNNDGIPPGGAGGSSSCSRSGGTGGTPGSGGNNGNA